MPVVIRLMRAGAKKRPFFRMVAADSRRQRDGRFLEILGHYNPLKQPYELVVHKDRVQLWLSRGAQPSDQAASLLRSLDIPMYRQSPPRKKPEVSAEKVAAKKAARVVAAKTAKAAKVAKAAKEAAPKAAKKPATKKAAKGKAAKVS
jgi:small subunit ribosomal protein S16